LGAGEAQGNPAQDHLGSDALEVFHRNGGAAKATGGRYRWEHRRIVGSFCRPAGPQVVKVAAGIGLGLGVDWALRVSEKLEPIWVSMSTAKESMASATITSTKENPLRRTYHHLAHAAHDMHV